MIDDVIDCIAAEAIPVKDTRSAREAFLTVLLKEHIVKHLMATFGNTDMLQLALVDSNGLFNFFIGYLKAQRETDGYSLAMDKKNKVMGIRKDGTWIFPGETNFIVKKSTPWLATNVN